MNKCKNCDREYHYCSSCDPEQCCDEGYCSDKCWKESKEYQDMKSSILSFRKSLDDGQKIYFDKLILNYLDSYYLYEAAEWIEEEQKNER